MPNGDGIVDLGPHSEHVLATWRREGAGLWRCQYVIEGYDKLYRLFLQGRLSRGFAEQAGKITTAKVMRVKTMYVHTESITKET